MSWFNIFYDRKDVKEYEYAIVTARYVARNGEAIWRGRWKLRGFCRMCIAVSLKRDPDTNLCGIAKAIP